MGLNIWDYFTFGLNIVIALSIPIYMRWKAVHSADGNSKTAYVFAHGSRMLPMMLSLARGTLGVRVFLGSPSELMYMGSGMWATIIGMLLAYPIVAFMFIPVYYSLGITSIYQYLEMRFQSRVIRCMASFSYIIRSLLNLAVLIFTPTVALREVLGLPDWVSICAIVTIGIIFNLLGGLKTAIVSDVFQGLVMILCAMIIIFMGFLSIGPIQIIDINKEQGRLNFFNWDLDPTKRVTTTSAIIGQLFMSMCILGCQQNLVQRYMSMESEKKVKKTLMANMPVIGVLFSLPWLVGMVLFATYATCDPLSLKLINKMDEILPFYVEDKLAFVPGFLGLFLSSLFNGALNIFVSNLNSIATVTWEDFFRLSPTLNKLSDNKQLIGIKIIGTLYGLILMALAHFVGTFNGVIESSMLLTSASTGPLLGCFLTAMLIPLCNWKGTSVGMSVATATILTLAIGSWGLEKPSYLLPTLTSGCTNSTFDGYTIFRQDNILSNIVSDATPVPATSGGIFALTYMYYACIGCLITIIVSVITSLITGSDYDNEFDQDLIHPLALKISKWFPGTQRRYCLKGLIKSSLSRTTSLTLTIATEPDSPRIHSA